MWAFIQNNDSVMAVKAAIDSDDLVYAQQLWDELDLEDQKKLMIAPKFGGCFSTKERADITNFWRTVGT